MKENISNSDEVKNGTINEIIINNNYHNVDENL